MSCNFYWCFLIRMPTETNKSYRLPGHVDLFCQLLLGKAAPGAQLQKDLFGFHIDHHLTRSIPHWEQKAKQLAVAPGLMVDRSVSQ